MVSLKRQTMWKKGTETCMEKGQEFGTNIVSKKAQSRLGYAQYSRSFLRLI